MKRVQQGYAFTGKDKTTRFEKTLTTTQLLNAKGMQKLSEDVTKMFSIVPIISFVKYYTMIIDYSTNIYGIVDMFQSLGIIEFVFICSD